MDYHSMKQKMVSLLFVLAFGCSVMHAGTPMTVTHADSWEVIKTQLDCDETFAKELRHFLMQVDDSIFLYLHYKSPEKNYATHITRFKHNLTTLKHFIEKCKDHPERVQAAKTLDTMHRDLAELIKHLSKAQGTKGMLAAMSLGNNIAPLLKSFASHFPSLTLTVDDQIKRHYNITNVDVKVLLGHIQKRLETK